MKMERQSRNNTCIKKEHASRSYCWLVTHCLYACSFTLRIFSRRTNEQEHATAAACFFLFRFFNTNLKIIINSMVTFEFSIYKSCIDLNIRPLWYENLRETGNLNHSLLVLIQFNLSDELLRTYPMIHYLLLRKERVFLEKRFSVISRSIDLVIIRK